MCWLGPLSLAGCAALQPKLEAPTVAVNSVRVMPGQGLNLRFLIGLHVQNPNSLPLPIHGVNYTVALSGQPVVSGNSQNQPISPHMANRMLKWKRWLI